MPSWRQLLLVFSAIFSLAQANVSLASVNPVIDTEIRILAVHDGSMNPAEMQRNIDRILDSWNATDLGTLTPTITFANGGFPLTVPGLSSTGAVFSREDNILDQVNDSPAAGGPSIRDQHGADVVIAFGQSGVTACGYAESQWIRFAPNQPNFVGNAAGLDLRGADFHFVVVVGITGACLDPVINSLTAAHELGHTLGGEHFVNTYGGQTSNTLYADANAYVEVTQDYDFGSGNLYIDVEGSALSAAATDVQALCNIMSAAGPPVVLRACTRLRRYSDDVFGGASGFNNANTFDDTALSVANYRSGVGTLGGGTAPQCSDGIDNDGDGLVDSSDSDCSGPQDDTETGPPPLPGPPGCSPTAYPPVGVYARKLNICDPPTDGEVWEISWSDACPGTHYIIRGNQAGLITDLGPVYGSSANVIVINVPAAVTVFSCVGSSCSLPSSPPVTITDGC